VYHDHDYHHHHHRNDSVVFVLSIPCVEESTARVWDVGENRVVIRDFWKIGSWKIWISHVWIRLNIFSDSCSSSSLYYIVLHYGSFVLCFSVSVFWNNLFLFADLMFLLKGRSSSLSHYRCTWNDANFKRSWFIDFSVTGITVSGFRNYNICLPFCYCWSYESAMQIRDRRLSVKENWFGKKRRIINFG